MAMDSNDEDVMAALRDEDLDVAAITRDANGDDEHLVILISLFAMMAEEDKPITDGSALGWRKSKRRHRMDGDADYFADDPLHGDAVFHRRFWMSRKLFLKIVENLRQVDYFKLKRDTVGELGFSIIQKCTMALRMLAYGIACGLGWYWAVEVVMVLGCCGLLRFKTI
nr:uncharacterized protein LOC127318325 [Lolium perenne]